MAKTSILTILIQLAKRGNADREVVKGLAQLKSTMGLALGTMGAFAGGAIAVGVAINKTVTPFVEYAARIREMSRLTGGSAEDMSRLVQAADDVKISYESLQKALWIASKQGIDVSVDSIAKLADQYVAIQSPSERATFLAKNFGKGGAEMGKLLELGGRGVQSATDAISDHLVLTEKAVQQAREYEIQLDNLNDQWEAFKIGVGQKVVPALNEMMFGLNNSNAIREEANRLLMEGIAHNREDAMTMAVRNVQQRENTAAITGNEMALHAQGEALREVAGAAEEAAEAEEAALKTISDANEGFVSALGTVTGAWRTYRGGLAEARGELNEGKITTDEYKAKIGELAGAFEETKNSFILHAAEMKLAADGVFSDEDLNKYLNIAKGLGMISDAEVEVTKTWLKSADDLTGAGQEIGTSFQHVEGRALEAVGGMESLYAEQAKLGAGIRSNALPASAALARTLGQLPPSGTAWDYFVSITTMRIGGGGGGGLGILTGGGSGGHMQVDTPVDWMASGGQFAGNWTLVGDAPGGRPTPFSELITPSGYVLDAATTQAILRSGLLEGFRSLAAADDNLGGGVYVNAGRTTTTTTIRRGRSRGRRGTISAYYSSPSGGSSGGGEIGAPTMTSGVSAAVETVADVVEPLAGVTQEAVQAFDATQQQQISEGIQTRNTIASGNGEMTGLLRENNELLRSLQSNMARAIAAAVEQVKG